MEATLNPTEVGDLSACDNEPIQIIGGIQNRGYLISFTEGDHRIVNVSANIKDLLDVEATRLPGRLLDEVFGEQVADLILSKARSPVFRARGRIYFELQLKTSPVFFEAYIFSSGGLHVLEFEATRKADGAEEFRQDTISSAVTDIREADTVEAAGQKLCAAVRELSGMDRVMVYRFFPSTWHGEVIAEDKVAEAHSFYLHRFPASDIPRQARALYLRNGVRFIHNSSATPIALVPANNPLTRKPLDLSDSRLRAVSPIHLEYLRNMQVMASFSLAIIVEEKLWGLVACHHPTELHLSNKVRSACEILTNAYAVRVRLEEDTKPIRSQTRMDRELRALLVELTTSDNPQQDLLRHHRRLESAFQASGLALVMGDQVDQVGMTPKRSDTKELAYWLITNMETQNRTYYWLNNLAQVDSRWETYRAEASGVLALSLPISTDAVMLIFRPEIVQTVKWGGDPRKNLERRDYQGRINPRTSFSSWTETIRNECLTWEPWEIEAACAFRDLMFTGLVQKQNLIRELSAKAARRS